MCLTTFPITSRTSYKCLWCSGQGNILMKQDNSIIVSCDKEQNVGQRNRWYKRVQIQFAQLSSPTLFMVLSQPSFGGVLLTTHQQCFGTFLLRGQSSAHEACQPLVFWCNSPLLACTVPPNHVKAVQTIICWWQSLGFSWDHNPALVQTTLFVG